MNRSRRKAEIFHRYCTPFLVALLAATALCAGCRRPLPQQGTPAERVYVQRCGSCHRAYDPSTLTAPMWQMQVDAMQTKMTQTGQPPLSAGQRSTILSYLQRNAGTQ